MSGGAIPLNGVAAVVTLPDALKFVAGSARVDGQPVAARRRRRRADVPAGNTAAAFEHTVTFAADATAADTSRDREGARDVRSGRQTPAHAGGVDHGRRAGHGEVAEPANVTVVEVTAKRTLTPRRPFEIPALEDAKIPAFDTAWLATQTAEPAIVWPLPDANPAGAGDVGRGEAPPGPARCAHRRRSIRSTRSASTAPTSTASTALR